MKKWSELKKWQKVCLIVVGSLLILSILKNQIIKSTITVSASAVVGADVKMDRFSISFLKQSVRIKGFRLYNPKGYEYAPMINIPEISVDFSVLELLKGKLYLPLLTFKLDEMVIIKDKDGKLNVDALKVSQKKEEAKAKEEPAKKEKKKSSGMMPLQIDTFTLKLGKVVVKDYSQGEPPNVTGIDVGIDKTFKDITSAEQLAALVLVAGLKSTAIKGAAIYGAASVLGVAFLPAGVAGVLLGNDSASNDFALKIDEVFKVTLETIKEMGSVSKEDSVKGLIKAKVKGASVTIKVVQKDEKNVNVTISSRKMMIPKPAISEGVLYGITQKLKK